MLTARNIEEAAKSVGIAPNTLLNWMKVPEFQAAYREARRAAYSQAVARLQQGDTTAATTLLKVTFAAASHEECQAWQRKPFRRAVAALRHKTNR